MGKQDDVRKGLSGSGLPYSALSSLECYCQMYSGVLSDRGYRRMGKTWAEGKQKRSEEEKEKWIKEKRKLPLMQKLHQPMHFSEILNIT